MICHLELASKWGDMGGDETRLVMTWSLLKQKDMYMGFIILSSLLFYLQYVKLSTIKNLKSWSKQYIVYIWKKDKKTGDKGKDEHKIKGLVSWK